MGRRLPGARDVRATLDKAGDSSGDGSPSVVVACPPHPQMGGDRHDSRLRAVSEVLQSRGIDCLRFDYGPWDEARGEVADAQSALEWANEHYEAVGLFGYSFGAGIALLVAGSADERGRADREKLAFEAVSVLTPPASIGAREATIHVDAIECPLQVVVGARDETVDWRPVVECARDAGADVVEIPADHFFAGQQRRVAEAVGEFFVSALGRSSKSPSSSDEGN